MSRRQYSQVRKQFAANAETLVLDVRELNTASMSLRGTGTFVIAFEGTDDGTNWYPITVARMNSNTVETTYSNANGVQLWETSCHLLAYIRMRVTGFTSNASSVATITGSEVALEPAPTSQLIVGNQTVAAVATATPGTTQTSVNSAASTNAAVAKASAANLYCAMINNTTAAAKFVRFYNKATAPTVGTDTPVLVITVPANSSKEIEFGQLGKRFATGLGHAITNAAGVLDATVVAAGDVQLSYDWV